MKKEEEAPLESLFLLQPNQTAEWYALINEAQVDANIQLPVDLESYLVFLLIRFTNKPCLAGSVLGLEYLEQVAYHYSALGLQTVGDKCLLFAGLFPDQAKRRRLTPSYFVQLGQTAYNTLAYQDGDERSLFHTLSEGFVEMMDVLKASRGPKELKWSKTESLYTYQSTDVILSKVSKTSFH